jgi:hypothetical protein
MAYLQFSMFFALAGILRGNFAMSFGAWVWQKRAKRDCKPAMAQCRQAAAFARGAK